MITISKAAEDTRRQAPGHGPRPNMPKPTKTTALLFFILLSSCAISKAVYLGDDIYSRKAGPHYLDTPRSAEDTNGFFPEAVHIKTRTQTFNA